MSAASSRLAPVNSRFHPSDASGREHGICIDRQRLLAKRILGFVGKLNNPWSSAPAYPRPNCEGPSFCQAPLPKYRPRPQSFLCPFRGGRSGVSHDPIATPTKPLPAAIIAAQITSLMAPSTRVRKTLRQKGRPPKPTTSLLFRRCRP